MATLALQPQLRPLLYELLKLFNRVDLFPKNHFDPASQGEARLAYWMMHPNEFQDAPEKIELVERITRQLNAAGSVGTFFVYRYQMPAGHWSGEDWQLGLAGPFFEDDKPFENQAGAFSRAGDRAENVKPAELIGWYVDMARRKGAPWAQ